MAGFIQKKSSTVLSSIENSGTIPVSFCKIGNRNTEALGQHTKCIILLRITSDVQHVCNDFEFCKYAKKPCNNIFNGFQ